MGDVKRINRSNIHDLISISKLLNIGDLDKAGKYLKEYQVKYPDFLFSDSSLKKL